MILFAVFVEGVYRHECLGIFDTQEAAEAIAKREMDASDGYHSFEVWKYELNKSDASDDDAGERVASFQLPRPNYKRTL